MDYQPYDNQQPPNGYLQNNNNTPYGYFQNNGNPPYGYPPQPPYSDKRSQGMATAAIVLGIIALSLVCCPYASIPCGALAITFALLSRGGERTCSSRGRTGLILGILGLSLGILFTIFAFVYSFILSEDSYRNRALYRDIYRDMYEDMYREPYHDSFHDTHDDIYHHPERYLK